MPELPEVETLRRQLVSPLTGKSPLDFHVFWHGTVRDLDLPAMKTSVLGHPIESVGRRGKYLCLGFPSGTLLFHLKMTGRIYLSPDREGSDPWTRFALTLSDGRVLIFSDARKFGRVRFVADLAELELGPEPLEMTGPEFRALFRSSARPLKAFLLDQSKIAGIGNIYADESLFEARIHPLTPANRLSRDRAHRLGNAIERVLRRAIGYEGATINWYRKADGSRGSSQDHFCVYGKPAMPCPRCGHAIKRIRVNQRSTHFCTRCQRF